MNPLYVQHPAELLGDAWILFREPALLWALVLLPALLLALPGARGARERGKNLLALLLRMLTLTALLLAASQPYLLRRLPDLSLVVARDLSASMSEARRQDVEALAARYLERVPEGVEVAEVWLGAEARVDGPPSPAPAAAGTSLTRLLDLAMRAAPPARSRRVLLLTDGADPRGEPGVSELLRVGASAGAQGVNVFPLLPAVNDVNAGVTGLELPESVKPGERVSALLRVEASAPTSRSVRLMEGERVLAERQVELVSGVQELALDFTAPRQGTWRLDALLDADPWPEDDARGGWLVSRGDGPVLAVGPYAAELAVLLKSQGLPARALEAWPSSVPEGSTLFVLAPEMNTWPETRPQALRSWVREQGVDLILAGGPRGLGSDEPWMDPLDRTLPVIFPKQNRREPPPLAVVYVVDRSDSMARSRKLALAVAAVEGSVAMLPPQARVGVLVFSDDFEWRVPMMRARSPELIGQSLSSLTVSGGTRIYPALGEAFEALQATDALLKHVILLTDGSGVTRYNQHLDLLQRINRSQVTVSTVALSAEANTDELRKVAEYGKGRYHYTETLDDVPRIFVDETMMLMRRNALEEDQRVRAIPGSPLAGSADWSAAPELGGRNEARAKATAALGLVAGDASQPLLASWRSGLGSATVLTSQLGGGWGQRWMEWPALGPWLVELILAVRERPPEEVLRLEARPQADRLELTLHVLDALGGPREGLSPELSVRGDSGEARPTMSEQAPGRYAAAVPWDGPLLVTASVDAGPGSPAGVTRTQIAPPTPDELRGPMLDLDAMRRLASASGGKLLPEPAELFIEGVRARDEERDAWPWLLFLALTALVLDVAVRRLPA